MGFDGVVVASIVLGNVVYALGFFWGGGGGVGEEGLGDQCEIN